MGSKNIYNQKVITGFNWKHKLWSSWASHMTLVVKNLPDNAGDIRDAGRSPREGHGNPLQYSCLENPMD